MYTQPIDQNDDQKKLAQFIEGVWNNHPLVSELHGKWQEWVEWFEGNQYTYWNDISKKLEDVSHLVTREIKNVYNRITPLVRQNWGDLTYRHEFYVGPNTMDPEDIKAAKVGSGVIEYLHDLRAFHSKIKMAKLWAIITGNAWVKTWWDESLFGLADAEGKVKKVRGDVNFSYINPFNARPDPSALHPSEWKYFLEGKLVPLAQIEAAYKIPKGVLKAQGVEFKNLKLFSRGNIGKPMEDSGLLLEYYETASDQFPKGRLIISCQGVLAYNDINPTPDADIPYGHIPGILPILDTQYSDSLVRLAQSSQRQLNRYGSQVDEYFANFKPKGMIPKGSLFGGDLIAYKRAGIDFIEYDPRFGQPYWQSPPSPPEMMASWLSFQEKEIETETSIREVSMGRLPKYASRASGVLVDKLREPDKSVLLPAVEEHDESLCRLVKVELKIVQKHYTEPRLIKLVGRSKSETGAVRAFKGEDLRDNTDVKVVPGVNVFTNKRLKEDVVMTFVEKGGLDFKKAMSILELTDIQAYMEDEFVDERQARRHIEQIRKTEKTIAASPNDNHEVCYTVFNNFRKTEEFEGLDKKIQKLILDRIEQHKTFLQPASKTPPSPEAGAETPALGPGLVSPPETPPPAGGLGPIEAEALMAQLGAGGGAPPAAGGGGMGPEEAEKIMAALAAGGNV